ncbi:MAG: hypothetical protein AAFU80_01495 [Pseudomonadota bacterium]
MIDLYPRAGQGLSTFPSTHFTYSSCPWSFDPRRHFSLRKDKPPRHRYIGMRHRLDVTFLGKPDASAWRTPKLPLFDHLKSPSGTSVQPIFQPWRMGDFYLDRHRTASTAFSDRVLLPIMHYRYSPAALAKIDWAVRDGGYSKGNAYYRRLQALIEEMQRRDATFLIEESEKVAGYDGFAQSGNAVVGGPFRPRLRSPQRSARHRPGLEAGQPSMGRARTQWRGPQWQPCAACSRPD